MLERGGTRRNAERSKKEVRNERFLDYNHPMNDGKNASVLERLLDPISRCLTPESARALVALRADDVAQARIAELAAKCNEGQLGPEERREYETYVHVVNVVVILQAKARLLLRGQAAS